MKRSNTRFLGLAVIAIMSIGSYIFLQTAAVGVSDTAGPLDLKPEMQIEEVEMEDKSSLPEVQLLKFVIETGKKFLPAS